jgi:hypothetical protein
VILCSEEQREFKESMRRMLSACSNIKITIRYGKPTMLEDLERVGIASARVIVIPAPAGGAGHSDNSTLKIVLALRGISNVPKVGGHIVAEMRETHNEELAKTVGGECMETVVTHDIMGRLMVLAAKQPGLAEVYAEILSFDGQEFRIKKVPQTVGKEFANLPECFYGAVVCGVLTRDSGNSPNCLLNPAPDYKVRQQLQHFCEMSTQCDRIV